MNEVVKQGAEMALQHAERAPVVVIAMGLLGAIVAFIGWFCAKAWPQHIQTQKDNREHLAGLLKQRGDEAAADVSAARELAKSQHDAIVSRVEAKTDGITGRLEKLSDRIDRNAESVAQLQVTVGRIAVKVGVTSLGLLLCGATCAPSLQTHERMGALSAAALLMCQKTASTCASALLCANAALDAGGALQAARERAAKGQDDAETTARALALPAAADAVCARVGVTP